MPSVYGQYQADLAVQRSAVQNDYSDAVSTMLAQGLPTTTYIDIYWDGTTIREVSTGNDILLSSDTIKFKYYDHLRGLFRKATENLYYP